MGCLKLNSYTQLQIAHTSKPLFSRKEKSSVGPYKYKYNGKELQDELGLNMTAMDFRQYDSAIARFVVVDAMAEQAYNLSPYRFGFNSPALFSDPTGLWEETANGWSTDNKGEIAAFLTGLERQSNSSQSKQNKNLDIYVNADKNDSVLGDSYKEVVKTEKVLTYLFGYSTLRTVNLPSNNKKGWENLESELKGLQSQGFGFNSFIIDSHGGYSSPYFKIGKSAVDDSNYTNTSGLYNYFKNTSVYILACHVGGGADPLKSMKFVQGLSNLWGATVYANRSWGPSWVFDNPLKVNAFISFAGRLAGKGNASNFRGQWLMASPGNSTPSIINNVTLHSTRDFSNPGVCRTYE